MVYSHYDFFFNPQADGMVYETVIHSFEFLWVISNLSIASVCRMD